MIHKLILKHLCVTINQSQAFVAHIKHTCVTINQSQALVARLKHLLSFRNTCMFSILS